MQEAPLISVVIPTYNRPRLLGRAIQSVVDQDHPNIEIIVVDDSSEIDITSVTGGFEHIRLLKNQENKGPCFSRNRGLEVARGAFINFLDDDDILLPGKLSKQLDVFERSENPKLGVVTCHLTDERSGNPVTIFNRVEGSIYRTLLSEYAVSGTETLLFKTEFLKKINGFDEKLESSQEYDLLIRFTEYYDIDYVDEVLTKKFRSENQIHLNFDKKISGTKYLYKKHDHRFKRIGSFFWLKKRLKLWILLIRFYIGAFVGEKAYRMLLKEK